MTPLQFSTVARMIYGQTWQRAASSMLGVNIRTVEHWSAGTMAIPPGEARELMTQARWEYRYAPIARTGIDQIQEILRRITGAENPETAD